jgi:hypothetical protein
MTFTIFFSLCVAHKADIKLAFSCRSLQADQARQRDSVERLVLILILPQCLETLCELPQDVFFLCAFIS